MNQNMKSIQSVQRAVDIINCVGYNSQGLTLKEISERLELNINTVRGLVNTLLHNGYLSKNQTTSSYALGFEFLSKSKRAYDMQIRGIYEIAFPHMTALAEKYNVTCWFQVAFYHDICTVDTVVPTNSHYAYVTKYGDRLPLHSSASGKLLLVFLPCEERAKVVENLELIKYTDYTITDKGQLYKELDKVCADGYSTELEEMDLGIGSIAAPYFNSGAALAGTLSVAAPVPIIHRTHKQIAADLLRCGNIITSEISKTR